MVIEFLSFEGCPHAPILRQRLDDALQELGVTVAPITIDLDQLFRAKDLRSGFGSPTILVNGLDLFGRESPLVAEDPACRLYRPALPSTTEVIERMLQRISASR
jgi:hypothetical protein